MMSIALRSKGRIVKFDGNLNIGGAEIGISRKAYIIAEVGINHEGNVENCKRLIASAGRTGVDCIKLQTIDANLNYIEGTPSHATFSRASLSRSETEEVFDFARRRGIEIFTTVGDLETMEWVAQMAPVAWKISSGLINNIPLIYALSKKKEPLLISTGVSTYDEIDRVLKYIGQYRADEVGIFQCTSIYPTPDHLVSLSSIPGMIARYSVPVGFSDHTLGSDASFLAVGAGATMIEKHFTNTPDAKGFDHHISVDENGMRDLVNKVRKAERLMGVDHKRINQEAGEFRQDFVRSIVAIRKIDKGEKISRKNVGLRRTHSSVPSIDTYGFFGLTNGDFFATKDIPKNTPIQNGDIQEK